MSERTRILSRIRNAEKRDAASQVQAVPQSVNLAAGHILFLQRAVGNRSARRMISADLSPAGTRVIFSRSPFPLIARDQQPGEARQSRVAVATSVQSFRTGHGTEVEGEMRGGLALALLHRLRDARQTVQSAVASLGQGRRRFGARPQAGEEPAGVALGQSSEAETIDLRAVVVGNAIYDQNETMGDTELSLRDRNMPGALTDAREISEALRDRGYTVRNEPNQTARQIESLLLGALNGGPGFGPPLTAGSELVFFFRGHGLVQGLIGSNGSVFTPAMMLSIRNQAHQRCVDFTLVLNACHSGVFADFIRSAELLSTRQAVLVRAARPGADAASLGSLSSLLDHAIAVQRAKNGFNLAMRDWWTRRFELEAPHQSPEALRAAQDRGQTLEQIDAAIVAHLDTLASVWNQFVARVEPLLAALQGAARAAGVRPVRRVRLRTYAGTIAEPDRDLQAQLDDIDTVLNQILQHVDAQLR